MTLKARMTRKKFLTALAGTATLFAGGWQLFFRRNRTPSLENLPTMDLKEYGILSAHQLGFQWVTADPFLFCVHHLDQYPRGNEILGPAATLAGRNIGQDFEPRDGWRMYHGERVPGFPGHPHRGFETITVVRRGVVDHSDSMGAAGRYGAGDVQWMTAGAGVQHAEMFPLLEREKDNTLELFQIWLNLPAKSKFAKPHFKMLWQNQIPVVTEKDASGRETRIELVAGSYAGVNPPAPPPDSWAADAANAVNVWLIDMPAGAQWKLPAAAAGLNRFAYFYEGDNLVISGGVIPAGTGLRLMSERQFVLEAGAQGAKILLLQGRPIAEPVVQYGPFVMNSRQEIEQAFSDYQRTRFGGWPWPSDEPVHGRDRGRFARHADGREETATG